jgi:hypothetical protein
LDDENVACGVLQRGANRRPLAPIALVAQRYNIALLGKDVGRLVGGAIVNDDNLLAERGAAQALQEFQQRAFLVVNRHDDRNQRLIHRRLSRTVKYTIPTR